MQFNEIYYEAYVKTHETCQFSNNGNVRTTPPQSRRKLSFHKLTGEVLKTITRIGCGTNYLMKKKVEHVMCLVDILY